MQNLSSALQLKSSKSQKTNVIPGIWRVLYSKSQAYHPTQSLLTRPKFHQLNSPKMVSNIKEIPTLNFYLKQLFAKLRKISRYMSTVKSVTFTVRLKAAFLKIFYSFQENILQDTCEQIIQSIACS